MALMMQPWFDFLHRGRGIWAAVALAVCIFIASYSRFITVDPSNSAFIVRNNDTYHVYQKFLKEFGSDETIIVGIEMPEGFTPELAKWLEGLTEALEKVPGVQDAKSLSSVNVIYRRWFGGLAEKSLLENFGKENKPIETLRKKIEEGPPGVSRLLTRDNRFTAVILRVESHDKDREYRHAVIENVHHVFDQYRHNDVSFHFTGSVVEQDTFVTQVDRDRRTFVPLTVAVVVTLLIFLQTDVGSMLYALLTMLVTLKTTEGLMVLLGTPVNAVTSLLAPVILIVAVSSTVHFSKSFWYLSTGNSRSDLDTVYRQMIQPTFLASFTTVIGFLSLTLSRVPALKEFGYFGAMGTAIAWVLTILWAPVFQRLVSKGLPHTISFFKVVGKLLAFLTRKLGWLFFLIALVFVWTAASRIPLVQTSTNLLQIFKGSDPFRRDTEFLEKNFGGIYTVEVILEVPHGASLSDLDTWQSLERFESESLKLPEVSHSMSLMQVVSYIEKVLDRARSKKQLELILRDLPEKMGAEIRSLTSGPYQRLRITFFLDSSDTEKIVRLDNSLRRLAGEVLPAGWNIEVTGQTVLLADMSQNLVRGEASSVGMAFGLILCVVFVTMWSVRYALLAVLPNLIPVVGLFGFMTVLKIPLNTATATIASVAIGLIFDNTIHLLCRYRDARRSRLSAAKSVRSALARSAQPMITTSLILAGGFCVTLSGDMTPTVQFGILSCITIGLAMLGDLIILPSLLVIFKP